MKGLNNIVENMAAFVGFSPDTDSSGDNITLPRDIKKKEVYNCFFYFLGAVIGDTVG